MYYYEQVACLFKTLQSEWNRYTLFFISLNHQDANSLQNIYNYITVSIETKNPNIIYTYLLHSANVAIAWLFEKRGYIYYSIFEYMCIYLRTV